MKKHLNTVDFDFSALDDDRLYIRAEIVEITKIEITQLLYFLKFVPVPKMTNKKTNYYKGRDLKKALRDLKERFEKIQSNS